jgi:hypothetical protein
MQTHEGYISAVAALAIGRLPANDQTPLRAIKLVYGSGANGTRGVTYFNRWKGQASQAPFVEISAFGQESPLQLAGTTIHELGHALAGWQAGHGPDWKAACERLGLRKAKAAGMRYSFAALEPSLRNAILQIPRPDDGAPVTDLLGQAGNWARIGGAATTFKPCGAGIGTHGGKSRGKGSGSRNLLWSCECVPPVKVRASRTSGFAAHCDLCAASFVCT